MEKNRSPPDPKTEKNKNQQKSTKEIIILSISNFKVEFEETDHISYK